jgi:hypothetical protein
MAKSSWVTGWTKVSSHMVPPSPWRWLWRVARAPSGHGTRLQDGHARGWARSPCTTNRSAWSLGEERRGPSKVSVAV